MDTTRHDTTRRTRAALAVATFGLVTLVGGCGGSSTKATPLGSSGGVTTSTILGATTSAPAAGPASTSSGAKATSSPTTAAGSSAKGSTGTQPAPAQLAAVSQDLNQAGSALTGTQSAITNSNVNTAKGQEGSAP